MNGPANINRPSVALAVPCGDRVHTDWAMFAWALGRTYMGRQAFITGKSSKGPAAQRNICVEAVRRAGGIDYILFSDSDMVGPADALTRLLSHGKDIACATYVRRGEPFDTLGVAYEQTAPIKVDTGLLRMRKIPTGLLLVKMSVFDKLSKPYFFNEPSEHDESGLGGEDYYFSDKAHEAGFEMWCDVDLSKQIGHMFEYCLRPTEEAVVKVGEAIAERRRARAV